MIPTPSRTTLPVGVGVAALADDTRAVWALVTSEGLNVTGEVDSDSRTTGAAVFAAIEQMLAHPALEGRNVTLFIDNSEHREQVSELASALGPIMVHGVSGGLGLVARTLVAETFPELAPEPEPEPDRAATPRKPRLRIGTDGSVGHGPGGRVRGGWSWVSEDGQFGVESDSGQHTVRSPLCAEVRAINLALRAFPRNRALRIFCDSKKAITVARMMADPATRAATGYTFPPALNKYELGALSQAIAGRDVEFAWIPGHRDPDEVSKTRRVAWALNDAADRLAVSTRRGAQFDTGDDVLTQTHTAIVDELRERLATLEDATVAVR